MVAEEIRGRTGEKRRSKDGDSMRPPPTPELVTPIRHHGLAREDGPSTRTRRYDHSFKESLQIMNTMERREWGHTQLDAIPGII